MASCATHKRSSPPITPTRYLKSGKTVDKDCHMPDPQPSNPRKRQRSEQCPFQVNEITKPRSKKQKFSHPSGSQPPPGFFDNLSKFWLTKSALTELDRRNSQPALRSPRSSYPRLRRPVTRGALAELENYRNSIGSPTNLLYRYTPRCLKDIKLFARHGGPDLSDLSGYPEPISPLNHTMSSSQSRSRGRKRGSTSTSKSKSTPNNTTTKSTGPYDRNFQQNLIDGGVYPHAYKYPDGRGMAKPNNWEEINELLARPRSSLSPSVFSEEAHANFVQADADAFKEQQVIKSVIPIIEGEVRDAKCVSGGIPFTNLDYLTDGNLVPGNPDLYSGARPEQLDRRVRDGLSGHITPSTQNDLPIMPSFFLTVKGPDGSAAVARRQASYDGALGARGMHSLQTYRQNEPVYDSHAYTITSTYHDGTLKMYTSHPTQPTSSGGRPEYHMSQINTWGMTGNLQSFRQGASAFRNAKDWTREQRDAAIRRANASAAEGSQAGTLAVDAPAVALAVDESDSSLVTNFAADASPEPSEIESLTQVTPNSPNEDSTTEISPDELALDSGQSTKQFSGLLKQPRSRRKRRCPSGSGGAQYRSLVKG